MPAGAATLLCAARCHLGEGSSYDAASDTAWWFDILEKHLYAQSPSGGAHRVHELPVMASALAIVDERRQLISTEHGLMLRDIASGRLDKVAEIEADDPATRSNDARVHPSGTFWVSTMGKRAEQGAGAIYAFRAGALLRLFSGISIPNAICFSPDGTVGYFADTRENTLFRVELDPLTGLPEGEPRALHRRPEPGGLDGAVTDAEGLIWCAIWGGGRVNVYSPAGELVRSLDVPARQPSCPVFVGRDFDRLLVTSAFEGMDEAARAGDPGHGRTFLLDVGARGRAEPRVRLGGL
ncbi:SMP-30/gluconolactonase/LRE family protein [Ancylobacter sonchi]|nr:SMP-30/gluconolactonase/LRE family protein [Ancylobacter sonchi]